MIRVAVVLAIAGMLLLVPILLRAGAMALGLYMAGALLVVAGVLLYVVAVIRELRRTETL